MIIIYGVSYVKLHVQGRNLLCIHSKKHIKNPPEDMARKSAQNLESMKVFWFIIYYIRTV